nr:PREDICTED: uncharacterized protein DDB_G0284459-like [Bemisia tabaci]
MKVLVTKYTMSKRSASPLGSEGALYCHPGKKRDYDEKELQKITVRIQRRITPERQSLALVRRSVSCPERIVIPRKPGEGSRPIFDRVELYQNSKDETSRIVDCRQVVKVTDKSCSKSRSSSLCSGKSLERRKRKVSNDEEAVSSSSSSTRNEISNHEDKQSKTNRSRSKEDRSSNCRENKTATHDVTPSRERDTTRESKTATNNNMIREMSSSSNNNNITREMISSSNNNNNTHTVREIIVPLMHQLRPVHPMHRGPPPAPFCIMPPHRQPPPLGPPRFFGPPPFRRPPLPPRLRPPPYHFG